jgi:hypothetical protein
MLRAKRRQIGLLQKQKYKPLRKSKLSFKLRVSKLQAHSTSKAELLITLPTDKYRSRTGPAASYFELAEELW